jgi:hypothetical protein
MNGQSELSGDTTTRRDRVLALTAKILRTLEEEGKFADECYAALDAARAIFGAVTEKGAGR